MSNVFMWMHYAKKYMKKNILLKIQNFNKCFFCYFFNFLCILIIFWLSLKTFLYKCIMYEMSKENVFI